MPKQSKADAVIELRLHKMREAVAVDERGLATLENMIARKQFLIAELEAIQAETAVKETDV